ncbi:hypothetical protein WAI453_003145 [Rhynchosporium graminicola]
MIFNAAVNRDRDRDDPEPPTKQPSQSRETLLQLQDQQGSYHDASRWGANQKATPHPARHYSESENQTQSLSAEKKRKPNFASDKGSVYWKIEGVSKKRSARSSLSSTKNVSIRYQQQEDEVEAGGF